MNVSELRNRFSSFLSHPKKEKKKHTSQTKYKPTAGCSTCSQLKRKKTSTICCLNRHMHCDVTDIKLLYSLSWQRGQRSAVWAAGRLFVLLFCVAAALISCQHEQLEPSFTSCQWELLLCSLSESFYSSCRKLPRVQAAALCTAAGLQRWLWFFTFYFFSQWIKVSLKLNNSRTCRFCLWSHIKPITHPKPPGITNQWWLWKRRLSPALQLMVILQISRPVRWGDGRRGAACSLASHRGSAGSRGTTLRINVSVTRGQKKKNLLIC